MDAWFYANGHPHRVANLHPSLWQNFLQQGVAPAVAAAQIAGSHPHPQAQQWAGGFASSAKANTARLRGCAKWISVLGWFFVGAACLALLPGIVLLLGGLFTGNGGVVAGGFLAAVMPLAGCFGLVCWGCLLLGIAEIFRVVSDFHDKYV